MSGRFGLFAKAIDWLKPVLKKSPVAGRRVPRGVRGGAHSSRPAGARTTAGDPIDVATGDVVIQQVDVELPGALPLVLERTHLSSYRNGLSFGSSWASTLDQRLEWDADGVRFASADGMVLTYPPPSSEGPVLPLDGPRRPLALVGDGGCVITDPELGTTLHFTSAGGRTLPLTAIGDRNGRRIDVMRDAEGMPTEIRHHGGCRIAVRTGEGRVTELRLMSDRDGPEQPVLMRYAYDGDGRLTEVIDSAGTPQRFEYDTDGRVIGTTERSGFWYRYTFDEHGRAVRGVGVEGCLDVRLDFGDRVTTVTDSLGNRTVYSFDDRGQPVAITGPRGGTSRFEWDRYGRPLAEIDPLGRATRFSYDDEGNLTAVTHPDETQTRVAYGGLGLPTEVIEPDDATWRQAYDQRGNLVELVDPTGGTERFAYDEEGNLTEYTDAAGATRRITSNAAGLPLTVTDTMGNVTRYGYDRLGHVASVTDASGQPVQLTWTHRGDLAGLVRPGGGAEHWTYDAAGNLTAYADAAGRVTRYEIGPFEQRTAMIGPDGGRYQFRYDTELRLTAVTNPEGRVWEYTYDAAGNLIRERDFNGRELRYDYDLAGQLTGRTSGQGPTIRYAYDSLGRLIEHRSGDAVTTFAYDPAGRLRRAVNADADLRFERDGLGRVTAEICNGRRLTTSYDEAGRVVGRRTPHGGQSRWEYDTEGRPIALRAAGQIMRFEYDVLGREVRRHFGDAVVSQEWDVDHRLTSQVVRTPAGSGGRVPVVSRAYAYGPDGCVTGIRALSGGDRRLDLDNTGRVTAVRAGDWSEGYAYDAMGNLTHAVWSSPVQAPGSEAIGDREYAGTLIRRAGAVRFENDEHGRVVLRERTPPSVEPSTWHYAWDAEDRLTDVRSPDGTHWRYRYDPLGRRIAKQRLVADRPDVVEQVDFVWNGVVLAEQIHRIGPGQEQITAWEYRPGTFHPLIQLDRAPARDAPEGWSDRAHAVITDLTGAATDLVESAGQVTWRSHRTLWGGALAEYAAGTSCPIRAPGQYFDAETGLHYNFRRYYDPLTGRYYSPDPLGLTPQPNPHAYVHNPLERIDPLGLAPTVRAWRYGDRTNPGELLSNLEKHGGPITKRWVHWRMKNPAYVARRAKAHASGNTKNSPFISVAENPVKAAQTTDNWLYLITRKSPDLAEFRIPADRLTMPDFPLSKAETEVLFYGNDLAEFLLKWRMNPYKLPGV